MLERRQSSAPPQIYVWDSFVRVFHWSLVASFAIAYLTEGDMLSVHVWTGYTIGILIVARILWGFVGTAHARFKDFIYDPASTFRYVRDLLLLRGNRYLGHSPAAATW
jgi:cytochrome b